MPHDLPKAYEPAAIEQRWAEYWVAEKLFHAPSSGNGSNPAKVNAGQSGAASGGTSAISPAMFSLLLPPPNVTGRLHMGHMLNQTEMDIIVRWRRMSGQLTLWLPGTDHAGIATQMMVERQLAMEGKKRTDLGREAFLERVWQWKQLYGGAILDQMRRLGASVDWQREYFTMDENLSRAVREVFVRLYEQGYIYRGNYIVNWCPRCVTAISDLEVVHEETQGKLYEIRYPVLGSDEHIVIATTRPETMLADVAVAVNPNDKRYQHLHGKKVRLPLVATVRKDLSGREVTPEIPIILDEIANPEFGTGAVKITPAHDPNDFAAGRRHELPQIVVMDEVARINYNGGKYAGMDRYEARKQVLADLQDQGLLAGEKDHTLPLAKCDRCKTVVEPRVSMQWFVKIGGKSVDPNTGDAQYEGLAGRAIEVVEKQYVRFTPEMYKTTYLNWMYSIHDWCISRQLWWGHRIPAWHCASCGRFIVAREAPTICKFCNGTALTQDTDVLDTWFSSALLPFTTFGWPEQTRDLTAFYPTSLLITGFDILFFWVARMIMMGCWFMGEENRLDSLADREQRLRDSVPFREVYIHALVRDAQRQKMSKTKGNVLDPIEVIEKYGTDATRFTLAAMASPGTDIAFNPDRTEGYRAFANKIWNAARFIFLNVDKAEQAGMWSLREFQTAGIAGNMLGQDGPAAPNGGGTQRAHLEDRWILSRLSRTAAAVQDALENYRFHEAANTIYEFFWGEFCDWYIEIVKLRLTFAENAGQSEVLRGAFNTLMYVFESALRLLSPIMPFLTEEVWHAMYDGNPPKKSIALSAYPAADPAHISHEAETQMAILQDLIVSVRNIRAELKLENKLRVPIEIHAADEMRTLFEQNRETIEKLANVGGITFVGPGVAKQPNSRATARFEVRVIYEQKIDVAAERERLSKELMKFETELERARKQLRNEGFLSKAPAQVVDGLKKRSSELDVLIDKTRNALDGLSA